MDEKIGDIGCGDILVENDTILQVGENISAPAGTEIIDAAGMIVMPGLVNAHIHTWMTGLRSLGGNWAGWDFFRTVHKNLGTRYTPRDNYLSSLVGTLNQLNSGATTIFDWCHNNKTPEHSDASIDALFDSGIRAVFGHGTVKPKQKEGEPHFSEIPHPRSELLRLRKGRLSDEKGLVTLAACILGSDYATKEVTLTDFRMVKELDILSSAHIWGRDDRRVKEGYHLLAKEGLLGPKHNLVHGNLLDDAELKVIVDSGVSVTSSATVELASRGAEPLIRRVLALGGFPSIGSDIEVSVAGDMFHVMRYALQTTRLFSNLERQANGLPPSEKAEFFSRDALKWATINNAKALCMEDRIGSLTPGKQADIIMLNSKDLNLFPVLQPTESVVFNAYPSNVDSVWVAGKKVKENGKLLFSDEKLAKVKEELGEAVERLLKEGEITLQNK